MKDSLNITSSRFGTASEWRQLFHFSSKCICGHESFTLQNNIQARDKAENPNCTEWIVKICLTWRLWSLDLCWRTEVHILFPIDGHQLFLWAFESSCRNCILAPINLAHWKSIPIVKLLSIKQVLCFITNQILLRLPKIKLLTAEPLTEAQALLSWKIKWRFAHFSNTFWWWFVLRCTFFCLHGKKSDAVFRSYALSH